MDKRVEKLRPTGVRYKGDLYGYVRGKYIPLNATSDDVHNLIAAYDDLAARREQDIREAVEFYPIPGFAVYEVNGLAVVRLRTSKEIVTTHITNKGYVGVSLKDNDGKQRTQRLNRVVLRTFRGEPPGEEYQAAHLNGVRTDNKLSNLVWATPQQNMDHQIEHGTRRYGEECLTASVSNEIAFSVAVALAKGKKTEEIASENGVSFDFVQQMNCGKTWAWMTGATSEKPIRQTYSPESNARGQSKFRWVDVLGIRLIYAAGTYSQRELAEAYGTSQGRIAALVRRDSWKQLPELERQTDPASIRRDERERIAAAARDTQRWVGGDWPAWAHEMFRQFAAAVERGDILDQPENKEADS